MPRTGPKKPRAPRKPRKAAAAKPAASSVPARAPGFSAHDIATGVVLRSSLRLALREGDVAAAGRVVARLRVDGAGIGAAELSAARLARAERAARDVIAHDLNGLRARPSGLRPAVVRAIAAGAVLCLFALLPAALVPSASQDPPPAALAGVLQRPTPESRGRSTATLPPVAVEVAEPTAAPTPAAEPEPTAAPAPATVATVAPVVRVGVPGGAVVGVPGGVVGGTGSATPTPSPRTTPAPTPMSAAALVPGAIGTGQSRLTLMVLDAASGEPVSGACVVLGTGSCGPSKPQTNALGLWWLDYPSGAARHWDISLVDPRYRSLTIRVITAGADQTVQVRLTR